MEPHKTKHTDHCCTCEGCGWGMDNGLRRHGLLRTLLIILGVLAIFWVGFKLGMIKGALYFHERAMEDRYDMGMRRSMMIDVRAPMTPPPMPTEAQ